MRKKCIVFCHGHPNYSKGGGEVAAYEIHRLLVNSSVTSIFVAWSGSSTNDACETVKKDEYLVSSSCDYFNFVSNSSGMLNFLNDLIKNYVPDFIVLHHYIHIGIDVAAFFKTRFPRVKVYLTLHEYLAICMNNGQMRSTNGDLCLEASPERCVKCFPHVSQEMFFIRKMSIMSSFSFIDHFISPSNFLKERYCAWGIKEDKITVLENPLPYKYLSVESPSVSKPLPTGLVLGYFGQINYFKGLDVILGALTELKSRGVFVSLRIHGKMVSLGDDSYINDLLSTIKDLSDRVNFSGPYEQCDVIKLMSECDFVVMGSRWFENSPVVIQEAIMAGVPIICPDIGGMKEKADGVGFFYRSEDSNSLAELITDIDPKKYKKIKDAVIIRSRGYKEFSDSVKSHLLALFGV